MDEQRLIAAVTGHRSLYDPTHSKYKDVELRNALWQQIAEDLKMEVETCKTKWRTLRDGFTRALRQQREARNGILSKVKKPWRFHTEMEFLIPFISSRESRANPPEQCTEGEDEDSPTKTRSPAAGDYENDNALQDNDDTGSISSNTGPEPPLLLPVTLMNGSQNHAGLKRHLEQVVDSEEGFDHLHCSKRQEMEVIVKERKLDSPRSVHCQCRCLSDDPTEAFFFSMGQSVKRLPFYLQAQVKMKVCQLVTEAEMECLDSVSNQ